MAEDKYWISYNQIESLMDYARQEDIKSAEKLLRDILKHQEQ